ncbi:MAG TPA: hypothetical protein VJZ93_03390 [Candidatus Nanoarchaeia archaeon]|nr:hypothetical protein [Candidatus Nanoarchaeia archaeon]
MVNLIKGIFTSQADLSSTSGYLQLTLTGIFLIILLFYFLNGIGAIYNRYSRYASFLSFAYLFVGLLIYNTLNSQYATSIFGFEISSVTLGSGIYFVPLVGFFYLILHRKINRMI